MLIWLNLECIFFMMWIVCQMIFCLGAYIFKFKSLRKADFNLPGQDEQKTDGSEVWSQRASDDFLHYFKWEAFTFGYLFSQFGMVMVCLQTNDLFTNEAADVTKTLLGVIQSKRIIQVITATLVLKRQKPKVITARQRRCRWFFKFVWNFSILGVLMFLYYRLTHKYAQYQTPIFAKYWIIEEIIVGVFEQIYFLFLARMNASDFEKTKEEEKEREE